MNRLKVTRLKLTSAAIAQLEALGLSLADLLCVICYARRTHGKEASRYRFDIEQVPAQLQEELRHLAGVELCAEAQQIVSARRLTIKELSNDESLLNISQTSTEESL